MLRTAACVVVCVFCVFGSVVVGGCGASCAALEPPYPDTFVAADLRLCVSTTKVPENLHRDRRDTVLEHTFAGTVRDDTPDDRVHFPHVLGTCSASSPARFIVEDERAGSSWMLSLDGRDGHAVTPLFAPPHGTVLSGRVATVGPGRGALAVALYDAQHRLVFAAVDASDGLFDSDSGVFGFGVRENAAVTGGAEDTACGVRTAIALDVVCGAEAVTVPANESAAICGGTFTNVLTWVPADSWTCPDVRPATIWRFSAG